MSVKVLFFASLRERLGVGQVMLDTTDRPQRAGRVAAQQRGNCLACQCAGIGQSRICQCGDASAAGG